MSKTTCMILNVGEICGGAALLFGDYSLSSVVVAQHFDGIMPHLLIWLLFLVGAAGCILLGLGGYGIARSAGPEDQGKILPLKRWLSGRHQRIHSHSRKCQDAHESDSRW